LTRKSDRLREQWPLGLLLALGLLAGGAPGCGTPGRGGGGGDDDDSAAGDDDASGDDDDDASGGNDDGSPGEDDDSSPPDDDDGSPGDDDDPTPPDDDDATTPPDDDDSTLPPDEGSGSVILTELMLDPAAVDDADGEWLELYNTTNFPIDLSGWTLSDLGSDSTSISPSQPLAIASHGYLVLGRSTSSSVNGGAGVDWAYGTAFSIANSEDEIILTNDLGTQVFAFAYTGSFPDSPGVSTQLQAGVLDLAGMMSAANWCIADESYTYGLGDSGTPGTANPACPAVPP
jgi:hypothetical protein